MCVTLFPGGETMERIELCERLREALELRGMRAADLVEKTGIPKGTISYYLSGKTEPKSDRIYIISQALNISSSYLSTSFKK